MHYYHAVILGLSGLVLAGCRALGYSDESVFHKEVKTICVQTFENRTFYRDLEFDLTSALAKRIEAQTPYRIVSDMDRADSVISGQIMEVNQMALSVDRSTGQVLESDVTIKALVNWKDLRTGKLLLNSQPVEANAARNLAAGHELGYACGLAINRLAQRIVQLMEEAW
ncbi:MAG: LPS assembly lipoprotein LptE [Sedimentisphaerales bacterium]|nr:LPS assembly lipoprotein LptE [Sedimentisphaerales bacterium]